MKATKILIVVGILVAGTIMQAQRGRDSGAGRGDSGAAGATSTHGIGGVSLGSTDTPETTRTKDIELKINDKLTTMLKTLLPEGSDPHNLSKGFVDLRDFVATVRASNNLKIPFGELKHTMVDGSSKALQNAIHALKPDVDPKVETKKANEQAKEDIKESKQS
jgi:hypothetical protein